MAGEEIGVKEVVGEESTDGAEPRLKSEISPLQFECPKCQGHSTLSVGSFRSFGFLELSVGEAGIPLLSREL